MSEVLRWFEDYAAHLRVGAASFGERGLDPSYLQRCQEFDRTVRSLDTEQLRAAAESEDGRRLVADLAAAQQEFRAASDAHRAELEAQRNGVLEGARALRGYSEAGGRGGEDGTFLSRRG